MSPSYDRMYPLTSLYPYYYVVHKVFINVTGDYEIRSNSVIDLYGYLYNEPFNATSPTMNLLMGDDDSGGSRQFCLQGNLFSSAYDLVVTTYSPSVTGAFSVSIGGSATVIIR